MLLCSSLLPLAALAEQATQDVPRICATCHGLNGVPKEPNIPNLWGQSEAYLTEQLQAFRSGKRVSDFMNPIIYQLSDEQIKRAASHFASQSAAKETPDFKRGQALYGARCADCHGADGEGKKVAERYVFPPLWGRDSYNWGAGMHGIDKAAAFIKSNMPLSQGGSLSDQQAWDLSLYINSQARPQDPRFKGDLEQTTKAFHGKYSQYGLPSPIDGHLLGSKAY